METNNEVTPPLSQAELDFAVAKRHSARSLWYGIGALLLNFVGYFTAWWFGIMVLVVIFLSIHAIFEAFRTYKVTRDSYLRRRAHCGLALGFLNLLISVGLVAFICYLWLSDLLLFPGVH